MENIDKQIKKIEEWFNYIRDKKETSVNYWLDFGDDKKSIKGVVVREKFDISNLNIKYLPFKILKIKGDFNCSNNDFCDFSNFPDIVEGKLNCSKNNFETMEGCPVSQDIDISKNSLKTLKGIPRDIKCLNISKNQLENLCFLDTSKLKYLYCRVNRITELPEFTESMKEFDVSFNRLTSLKGAPKEIINDFNCSYNKLTSLNGSPKQIIYNFDCSNNNLASLKGCPQLFLLNFNKPRRNKLSNLIHHSIKSSANFNCSHNNLTSLEGSPKKVSANFDCSNNKLTSLKGCPNKILGDFSCERNDLISLQYMPSKIEGDFKFTTDDCMVNKEEERQKIKGTLQNALKGLDKISKEDLIEAFIETNDFSIRSLATFKKNSVSGEIIGSVEGIDLAKMSKQEILDLIETQKKIDKERKQLLKHLTTDKNKNETYQISKRRI